MRLLLLLLLTLILLPLEFANANGGAAALDEMILHQKAGLEKARTTKTSKIDKEVLVLFDEIISMQEKELERMTEMRKKFPEGSGPINLTSDLQEEFRKVERELQDMFGRFRSRMNSNRSTVDLTSFEIKEDRNSYDIVAKVPGWERKDIKIKIEKNSVIIEGKREEEIKRLKDGQMTSERSYAEFKRSIKLDEKVDPSSMKVKFEKDTLTVHLDKLVRGHRA